MYNLFIKFFLGYMQNQEYKEMMDMARSKYYDMYTKPIQDHLEWALYTASLMEDNQKTLPKIKSVDVNLRYR